MRQNLHWETSKRKRERKEDGRACCWKKGGLTVFGCNSINCKIAWRSIFANARRCLYMYIYRFRHLHPKSSSGLFLPDWITREGSEEVCSQYRKCIFSTLLIVRCLWMPKIHWLDTSLRKANNKKSASLLFNALFWLATKCLCESYFVLSK